MKQCAWADNVLVVETDGYTRPCCLETRDQARLEPLDNGLISAWNSQKLQQLRKNLNNGYSVLTDPWCSRCRVLEESGQPSLRTQTKHLGPAGTLKAVQFKLSNRCQLECAHCGPFCSSQHAKRQGTQEIRQATKNIQPIIDDLITLLPQLDYIKFTGGEPWMDPQHWQILEALAEHDTSHCELRYISNGLATRKEHLWKGWKDVKIQISIDGVGRTYEWFRRNASWNDVYNNVIDLRSKYTTGIVYCITPWTAHQWNKARSIWSDIQPLPVVRPWYMDVANLPASDANDFPFAERCKGKDITKLVQWARSWDAQWNTQGWAEELFEWINA